MQGQPIVYWSRVIINSALFPTSKLPDGIACTSVGTLWLALSIISRSDSALATFPLQKNVDRLGKDTLKDTFRDPVDGIMI